MARRDYFKELTGKTRKEVFGRTSHKTIIDTIFKKSKSRYALRSLGKGVDGELLISEEERAANFHILGAPGEGKSKFIESQIRKDIDAGNGLCLIDPSEGAIPCKMSCPIALKLTIKRLF